MADNIEFTDLPIKARAYLSRLSAQIVGVVPIETNAWKFASNKVQPNSKTPGIVFDVAKWGRTPDDIIAEFSVEIQIVPIKVRTY